MVPSFISQLLLQIHNYIEVIKHFHHPMTLDYHGQSYLVVLSLVTCGHITELALTFSAIIDVLAGNP